MTYKDIVAGLLSLGFSFSSNISIIISYIAIIGMNLTTDAVVSAEIYYNEYVSARNGFASNIQNILPILSAADSEAFGRLIEAVRAVKTGTMLKALGLTPVDDSVFQVLNRYPTITSACYLDSIYRTYNTTVDYNKYKTICTLKDIPSKDIYYSILSNLFSVSRHYSASTKASAQQVWSILTRDLCLSRDLSLQVLTEILPGLRNFSDTNKQIKYISSYLSKIVYGDKNIARSINVDNHFEALATAYQQDLTYTDMLDVALETRSKNGATNLHVICTSVLPLIKNNAMSGNIIFYNATPKFAKLYSDSSSSSVTMLSNLFGNTSIRKTLWAENQNLYIYSPDYAQHKLDNSFDIAYFSDHDAATMIADVETLVAKRFPSLLFVLLPDDQLNSLARLEQNFLYIRDIHILPQSLMAAAPKRQILAVLIPSLDKPEFFAANTYSVYRDKSDFPYLIPQNSISEMDYSCLYGAQSVRSIIKSYAQTSVRQRALPKPYLFSREIKFFTVRSASAAGVVNQGYVYVAEQQVEKSSIKGRKIEKSVIRHNADSIEAFDAWVADDAIYRPSLRQTAIAVFKSIHRNEAVSLRTIWYIFYDAIHIGISDADELKEFALSDAGEAFVVPEDDAMSAFQEQLSDSALEALSKIFDCAVRDALITENPLLSLLSEEQKKEAKINSLAQLNKTNYSSAEERVILDYLIARLDNGPDDSYLGAYIYFLTGIYPKYIAALSWSDFYTNTGFYQLILRKYLDKSGKVIWENNPDKTRVYPIMSMLGDKLNEIYNRRNPAAEDRIIRKCPDIVSKIQKRCKEADAAAKIPSRIIHIIRNDQDKDLNAYSGARFHSNFEHRCRTVCGLTIEESQYMMSRKMPSVLTKHYVDFASKPIQAGIAAKLSAWSVRYSDENTYIGSEKVVVSPDDGCIITIPAADHIKVTVSTVSDITYSVVRKDTI